MSTNYEELEDRQQMSTCDVFKEEIVMLKWRILIFACFLTFGSYYIYDFPGSIGAGKSHTIESRFVEHNKKYNQEMNQALYSVYSWPNTVLAVGGGLLIDKFLGLRKAIVLFVSLVFLGSVVFFIGVWSVQYPLLILGRFIFGLGGESLSVAQSAFVARWFKGGRGMALAFGITISFSRVGSSFNFLLSPMFANHYGIVVSTMCGMFACAFSALSATAIVALDILGTRRGIVPPESKETSEPFKITDITRMPPLFWVTSGICVTVYCAIFPLIGVAKNYFQVKYDISEDTASSFVSIYQFVCAGGSPICGGLVDTIGRFTHWMILAATGFTGIHLIFIVSSPPVYVMMAIMGLFYSVVASSLWPCVPYIVDPALVGLAYGIMTAMQNTGLAIWPLVVGAILDAYTPAKRYQSPLCDWWNANGNDELLKNATFCRIKNITNGSLSECYNVTKPVILPASDGFKYTEMFFMATAASGLVLAVILLIMDRSRGGILASNPARREELKKAQMGLLNTVNASEGDKLGSNSIL